MDRGTWWATVHGVSKSWTLQNVESHAETWNDYNFHSPRVFPFSQGLQPVFSVTQYLKIIASGILSSLTIVYHKRETKTCYFIKAVARLQCFQTKMWPYWCLLKLGESTLNMDFKTLLKDMLNLLGF